MSQDVLATLQQYLAGDGKSINVPPAISNAFGTAIGTAIQELFSGGIQVNGANFALTGTSATATISGTGSAAPLLQQIQVTATFTATSDDVTLAFSGSIQSNIPISDAWPSELNFYPFNAVTLTAGNLNLNVDPGASTFDLSISATVSFENATLGTGLFEVTYDGTSLGYLGGVIVSGTWTPFSDIPVLSSLSITSEIGTFFSTITASDLSAFSGFPFVPESVDPGLTIIAMIKLDGTLEPIQSILPAGSELQLTAIVPEDGGLQKASVAADLAFPATNNAFQFNDLSLAWQSTSADSGTITLSATATVNISASDTFVITGSGTFTYGTSPSLSVELDLKAPGGWLHPFGIPNLAILEVAVSLTLSDEGIGVALAGQILIGTQGQGQPVVLTAGAGFLDFEVPDYVAAELSAQNPDASVSLSELINDFIPSLPSDMPLLNSITFTDLQFWAVAAPVTILGKSYSPGIGASGTISFFGYELDFGFNLITSPETAIQAKGVISYNGGPIVITGGGITWLTISSADGLSGASACIDTTGGSYCNSMSGIQNAYFAINAKVTLLGLVSASIVAVASKSIFNMELSLSAGGIFTENLSVGFDPSSGAFNAAVQTGFNPPSISFPSIGPIPSFSISLPSVNLSLALGTVMPSVSPFSNGWMPSSAPYFYFDFAFSFYGIDLDFSISLDINQVTAALNDFGSWLVNWIFSNASMVLDFILKSAELLTKLLLQLLTDIVDLVKYVAQQVANFLGMAFEEAYKLAGDIWDGLQDACSVITGDDAMGSSSSFMLAAETGSSIAPAFTPIPVVLADLTESSNGQAVLFHYYENREEFDRILHADAAVRARANAAMSTKAKSPRAAEEAPLTLILDLIKSAAPAGSEEFQKTAQLLVSGLEPHADKNYRQLLEGIKNA